MIHVEIQKQLLAGVDRIPLRIDFHVEDGELIALYGPSGSGKTSVLRMIAGLMLPDAGVIAADALRWFDSASKIFLPPQHRDVGVVFQDYALFPNMTVRRNIAYGLRKDQPAGAVDEVLELMELSAMQDVRPGMLSGGQKQRVALARAIVRKPKVLLLDEPTSSLDATLRVKIQEYIRAIHDRYRMTTVLITHDILEVARLAGRVLLMEQGTIRAQGTPREVLPLDELRDLVTGIAGERREGR